MNATTKMAVIRHATEALIVALSFFILSLPVAHGALPPVDIDYDGDVDGMDLAEFSDKYADADPAADIDSSGHVDTADVARFAAAFGSRESFLYVYDVGPGWPYADPSDVPWESMAPGSLVRIHYREIPYANKWVLAVAGTADAPIVLRGIPQNGLLPIITGENATTRLSPGHYLSVQPVRAPACRLQGQQSQGPLGRHRDPAQLDRGR